MKRRALLTGSAPGPGPKTTAEARALREVTQRELCGDNPFPPLPRPGIMSDEVMIFLDTDGRAMDVFCHEGEWVKVETFVSCL